MGAAATTKKTVKRKINLSQPSQLLKLKQKTRVRALLEEEKRQAAARKQYENFLKQFALQQTNNNNNSNSNNNNNSPGMTIASIRATMMKNAQKKRKTRKLRR
jgi:transcriptional regulator of met regulon